MSAPATSNSTLTQRQRIERFVSQGVIGMGLSAAYSFAYFKETAKKPPAAVPGGAKGWSLSDSVGPGIVGGVAAGTVAMGVYAALDYGAVDVVPEGTKIGPAAAGYLVSYVVLFATFHNAMKPNTVPGRIWTSLIWGIIAASLDSAVRQWY